MINILLYGNCQTYAILNTLNLDNNQYKVTNISCFLNDIDENSFKKYIEESDIIITQPINDNYRDKSYLSTSFIIKNCTKICKIIIFDSCHFDFYYFDLTYKFFNNDLLHEPSSYHYNMMIDCYKNNHSIEYYIENYVNNLELKTSNELETIAGNSLDKLNLRYIINKEKYTDDNIYIISIYDFVKNNYKNKLLFYSMNHPTKYVFHFISEEIIKYLQITNTINYDIDPLEMTKCILYKCIQQNVNFIVADHKPLISTISYNNEITKLYYDTYKKIGF